MKQPFCYILKFFTLALFIGLVLNVKAAECVEDEPIDVVFKYIDLTDKNLHREGIKQIKKDEDNEEIRYAMRSVLKNIPWVRKIFIIMPNEKVRFLKPYDEIKDKIVYVRDKDLLGFDSASSIAFEYNLWRMKKFGCCENFIYLNDDYFIGKPLRKSDFFYKENRKIVPYIIYGEEVGYGRYNYINNCYKKHFYESSDRQTFGQFLYQNLCGYMFLYKYFGRDIVAPKESLAYSPHNAYGQNLSESKEIYDVVQDNYEYPDSCLNAIYREKHSMTQRMIYSFYFINKYNRRINNIDSTYIDLKSAKNANFNHSLFCINTGGDYSYSFTDYITARISMMRLFPKATKYEIPEISEGIYEISSALDNNMVIDVQDAGQSNGCNIQLWKRKHTGAQRFEIRSDGKGCYTIKAKCSGKMLDVTYAGQSNGTNIWQYGSNSTDAQKWYIVPLSNGYYVIVSKSNGLYIDVQGASTNLETNIQCFEGNATLAQKFKLRKVQF